jgi:hypothetical protein
MSLAKLKPKYRNGGCSVELVDVASGRRVEVDADFRLRQLQLKISDHHVAPRMAIGATVSLAGLAGFMAMCQRATELHDQGGGELVTADELAKLHGDDTIDHTPTHPRRKK